MNGPIKPGRSFSFTGVCETTSEATFFDVHLAYQLDAWGQQQDFVIGAASIPKLLFEAAISGKLVAPLDSSQDKSVLDPKKLFCDAIELDFAYELNDSSSAEGHICDTGENARARYRGAILDILRGS